MELIVTLYVLTGLLIAGLAIPLLRGKVPPNHWYGFRIRRTLEDPDVWYPVNAWAARRLLIVGLGTTIAGLVGMVIPEPAMPAYSLVLAAAMIAAVMLILVFGIRYARSLPTE
jgi:hypothetical protein